MDVFVTIPPWLPILVAAVLLPLIPRAIGFAIAGLTVALLVPSSLMAPSGSHLTMVFLGFDATIVLVDDFTRLLGMGFGILGTAAVWYAYSSGLSRVSAGFALSYIASTIGVVFAGDWLTLVFFWELMAVTSTLMVWVYGGDAVRAGYRYAIIHGIGGSLLLFAVTWHYAVTGTFTFGETGFAVGGPAILALAGIGVNCGFIGVHTWLPDTYPRPHAATSVFLSVFTTKTSAYVLYRGIPVEWTIVGEVDLGIVVAYMGGAMAVYGVVFALLQHDMRALLSYHIQAQVGYMVAGIGIGTSLGVAGAMGHLFNNVMYKALLFMAVGVIILRTNEHDLYKLGGLWREMPITAVAFALGALSITAVPGTNGFISKGMVLDAADPGYYGAPEFQALYWLLMIGAVGTFLSFIKLGYYAFLHGPSERSVAGATAGQTIGMLSIGAVCLLFGILWVAFVDLLPAGEQLIETGQANPYSMSHLLDAGGLIVVSVVGFVVIKQPLSRLGHVRDMDRWLHPLAYYTGRGTMRALTESYALIDRAAVRVVVTAYWIGNNPVQAATRIGILRTESGGPEGRPTRHPDTIVLRASIGFTVLLVTLMVTAALMLLI